MHRLTRAVFSQLLASILNVRRCAGRSRVAEQAAAEWARAGGADLATRPCPTRRARPNPSLNHRTRYGSHRLAAPGVVNIFLPRPADGCLRGPVSSNVRPRRDAPLVAVAPLCVRGCGAAADAREQEIHCRMSTHSHQAKHSKLVAFGHYIAVFVLILKAVSYSAYGRSAWPFIGLCLVSAAVILIVTLLHERIEARFPQAQCLVHLFEAAVCAAIAYKTHAEGKVGLPYAWGLAGLVLLARALWEFQANRAGAAASEA